MHNIHSQYTRVHTCTIMCVRSAAECICTLGVLYYQEVLVYSESVRVEVYLDDLMDIIPFLSPVSCE